MNGRRAREIDGFADTVLFYGLVRRPGEDIST